MNFHPIQRRFDALRIYLLLEGASALLFQLIGTIYVVFYAKTVGLDALQIVAVGTIFEGTIFLCEIPTGIVADVYSRRLSVILGVILTGSAFLIEGLFPTFAAIVIGEVICGVGSTFLSGATEAWIADETGEARAGAAFVRAAQVRQLAGLIGIATSVVLASVTLRLPIIVAGVAFLALAIFLTAVMPETGFQRATERASWRTLIATARSGFGLIRLRPVLGVILAVSFVVAFHSEGFDHLWQKHILDNFTLPVIGSLDPVVWFGVLSLGATLLSLIVSEVIRRRVDLADHRATVRVLIAVYAVQPICILLFSLTGSFGLALVAYWGTTALRGSSEPLMKAWINQNVQPQLRATLFSLNGQVGAFGEMVGGLPIGAIAQLVSLRAALAATGVILALVLPLFGVTLRQHETISAAE